MNSEFASAESLELAELEIFLGVFELGTVKSAAARLHRAPSSVSTRLCQLESKLKKSLFTRTGRRLEPTAEGQVLSRYARDVLRLTREAREAIGQSQSASRLRLGSMDSTAAARLPALISEFHQTYPDVSFELSSGTTDFLIQQVLEGGLDGAFVADVSRIDEARLAHVPVFHEQLVLVASKNQRPIRSPHDVAQRTLLAFGKGCNYRQRLYDWFVNDNLIPDRTVDLGSYHAILGSVAAGMGIALLPYRTLALSTFRDMISVHELPVKESVSVTSLVWSKDSLQTPALQAFFEIAAIEYCDAPDDEAVQMSG